MFLPGVGGSCFCFYLGVAFPYSFLFSRRAVERACFHAAAMVRIDVGGLRIPCAQLRLWGGTVGALRQSGDRG
jgi:hypothetical protein